jgi:hypothetical protein
MHERRGPRGEKGGASSLESAGLSGPGNGEESGDYPVVFPRDGAREGEWGGKGVSECRGERESMHWYLALLGFQGVARGPKSGGAGRPRGQGIKIAEEDQRDAVLCG